MNVNGFALLVGVISVIAAFVTGYFAGSADEKDARRTR